MPITANAHELIMIIAYIAYIAYMLPHPFDETLDQT